MELAQLKFLHIIYRDIPHYFCVLKNTTLQCADTMASKSVENLQTASRTKSETKNYRHQQHSVERCPEQPSSHGKGSFLFPSQVTVYQCSWCLMNIPRNLDQQFDSDEPGNAQEREIHTLLCAFTRVFVICLSTEIRIFSVLSFFLFAYMYTTKMNFPHGRQATELRDMSKGNQSMVVVIATCREIKFQQASNDILFEFRGLTAEGACHSNMPT
jgi:hypothetical protein